MTVTKFVKAFIQVVGLQKMPSFPADVEDVRIWYQNVCFLLYLPLFSIKLFSAHLSLYPPHIP